MILELAGGLYEYYHSKSGAGAGIFWLGIVLLIVASIFFLWNGMKKPMMAKTWRKTRATGKVALSSFSTV